MLDDLCLVSDLREELSLQAGTDVSLIARYATGASVYFAKETNRVYKPTLYTERRNGTGTEILVLKNTPIIEVQSLMVDGVEKFPSLSYGQSGYVQTDDTTLELTSGIFSKGILNVCAVYWGGFGAKAVETTTLATTLITVKNSDWFSVDAGVTYGSTVFAQVQSNPSAGQYVVDPVKGQYTFSSADLNKTVVISYRYRVIPQDLQDAVVSIAAQRYKRRTHIDQDSQTQAGTIIQFSHTDVPRATKLVIDNYFNRGFMGS